MLPHSKYWTEAWLHVSEIALLIFGITLSLGLVGEFLADHKKKDYPWCKKWKREFEILVILGVMGELLADGGIFSFGMHLQTIADQEVAAFNAVAEEAKERASITESNNLVLQKQLVLIRQWRTITPEQKKLFIELTKDLRKQTIRVRFGPDRPAEVESFASRIRAMLDAAGYSAPPTDQAFGPWSTGMNLLYLGGLQEVQSLVFLNNYPRISSVVDMGDTSVTYTNYSADALIHADISIRDTDQKTKAFTSMEAGKQVLHVPFPKTAADLATFLKVEQAFEKIGIGTTYMVATNIPEGSCEIFVNPK